MIPLLPQKTEAGFLYILASLPEVVSAAKLTGVGSLSAKTIEGTAYTVPTADFQSTVTAGGEQYIVSFKVTESPTGGNTVHSVDVVRVPKAELNAQYDQNVAANGNGGPTGTSPSLESGGGEGYNGSGDGSVDGSNGTDPKGGPGAEGAGDFIDGVKIIDGKVGGKIPVDEFKTIRQSSIKNPESTTLTLGKFTPTVENGIEDWSKPGPDSYIVKAGKTSYFNLGSEYKVIQMKYGLKDPEMFDYLNKPALDEAISKSKTIRFSHNPLDYEKGAIVDEWEYIKSALGKTDSNLIKIGDYWYVR